MATEPISPAYPLDIREQLARLDRNQAEIDKWRTDMARSQAEVDKWRIDMAKTQAETAKVEQEKRLAPLALAFTGLGAGAALFAAGAAFAKLILG